MILHGYYRSSASYRLRIALNIKGIDYRQVSYILRDKEHRSDNFLALNPQGLVPALEMGGHVFFQSLATIEYINDIYPQPALLPADKYSQWRVKALAQWIACDVHPLNNLRVLEYLARNLNHNEHDIETWVRHWITTEFTALEKRVSRDSETGLFMHGDSPTIADIFLVPQIYNARRFNVPMSSFPVLDRINQNCLSLEVFHAALPELPPDAL